MNSCLLTKSEQFAEQSAPIGFANKTSLKTLFEALIFSDLLIRHFDLPVPLLINLLPISKLDRLKNFH